MENFLLIVHVVVALIIIGLIMVQQGKGAEMGASFGSGSSQTVFGAAGTGNLFSKLTAIFVAVFFATSFALAVIAKKSAEIDEDFIPTVEQTSGAASSSADDLPAADLSTSSDDALPSVEESGSSEELPNAE